MIEFPDALRFPVLRRIDERAPIGYGFYRLDWSEFVRYERVLWDKFAEGLSEKGVDTLPEKYLRMTEGPFLLNSKYLEEVHRNVRLALEEYDHAQKLSFDTMIREMCLEPGEAHVSVSFRLLGDCFVKQAADGKWERHYDPTQVTAMLWRMWFWQTGRAIVERNARLPYLKECADVARHQDRNDEARRIEDFIQALHDHEASIFERPL